VITPAVVVAGATIGAGVAVIVRALVTDTPDLRDALARLDTPTSPTDAHAASGRIDGMRADTLRALVTSLHLGRYTHDLDLVGETATVLAARKVGYALLGLTFPLLLAAGMVALGATSPVVVPLVVSLVLAAVLFWVPDADLHRRAAHERDAMRRTVCAYLELVALERAGDAGTVEALERAATVADTPAFTRIRDALTHAELAGQPPWTGLADLAETTGVTELGDLADIMALSGTDGAAVYTTLRARAASLRHQLLSATAAAANAASEHMIIPVALLGIAFMALLGYPAFARILS